ncbi:4Fe-4S binding protein [Parabacteroides pacaensis]|uniref:4Fe-4S binding protein n=1 Tax=Parabacteroides pacaensis TaxID=2086575 RepID=UPI000D0F234D|nr:4Fe-4S binding protein [Parabacteroides pacaensis]
MNSFINYIQGACTGIKSLLIGMRTSIRVFFRAKVTEQYPENRDTLHISERFRGTLVMPHDAENHHQCIACGLCQAACPNDTIRVISETRTDEEGKKKKILVKYEYNLGSCMFCELCVNACPHDAIRFCNEFENAVFEKEKLLLQLNHEGSTVKSK